MVPGGNRAARHAGPGVRRAGRASTEPIVRGPGRRTSAPDQGQSSRPLTLRCPGWPLRARGRGRKIGSRPTSFWNPGLPRSLLRLSVAQVLGARDSGKTSLWIDQAPNQTIVLDWELQPRAGHGGRSFALALPGNETTVLTLEVPRNWVPSCRRGIRRGPEQGRQVSDRRPVGSRA